MMSANAMARLPRDFYEIQKRQRRRSLFLFAAVLVFHFVFIGFVGLAFLATFGLVLSTGWLGSPEFWPRFLLADLILATVVAVLHFLDARRNGPRFILRRLQAATPDAADRYHAQFLHTLDEIRIAAGLPRVNAYVLPSFAVNSLAVIEADGTPAVAVTEGLLAEGTRDELQAVAAHELAHIARGDAFYLTLVCSLANFFEKFKDVLEPEGDERAACGEARGSAGFPPRPLLRGRGPVGPGHAPAEHARQPGARAPGRRRGRRAQPRSRGPGPDRLQGPHPELVRRRFHAELRARCSSSRRTRATRPTTSRAGSSARTRPS